MIKSLKRITLLLLAVTGISTTAHAASALLKDQSTAIAGGEVFIEQTHNEEARGVVMEQLKALKNNDKPKSDAGIRTAWDYAHPSNREATGPLDRFVTMLKSPTYRELINHQSHEVRLVDSSQGSATFEVIVYPEKYSAPLKYFWSVATINTGKRKGEWATTAVSAPLVVGVPPA